MALSGGQSFGGYMRVLGIAAAAGLVFSGDLPAADVKLFDVWITGGKIAEKQRVMRITQGMRAEIHWRSDKPAQVHLHGLDLTVSIAPRKTSVMTVNAIATGRFPFTLHGDHGPGHSSRAIAYLEVMPR